MTPRRSADLDRHPTLATVAAAAGVSRMTVSNAFNRPDAVSPAMLERVLAAARELGYAGPDPVARTLSRGRTGSIGLVLDFPLTWAFVDAATVQFVHGVAEGCEQSERGLSLVPRIAGRDAELVHTALVDGFVLYCMEKNDARLEAVRRRRLPYVLVDHEPYPGGRFVNVDDRGATRDIARHMLELGHERFAIVMGYETPAADAATALAVTSRYHVHRERLAGWRDGLAAAGIDFASVPVSSPAGESRATGRLATLALLDRAEPPTAVLAMTDQLALGALDAAAERGVDVPGELSVTGFDDIPEAAAAGLTTVRQPHHGKGVEALRLLLDGDAPDSVLLPTQLVSRSSTAPAP